ncbi:MAG: DUF1844 domain-containing protein [Deltaproteobacteria bacterium]|nr:DUF1844 domain-containing protein [Deltaproteobacteria bacterium]
MGEKPGDFKVVDRRRFTAEGEVHPEGSGECPKPREATTPPPKPRGEAPISFAHLVLSLASSAQIGMGVVPDPATGKKQVQLPMARETIDLLEILQEKTKGNLVPDEASLLEELLYTLRMQYVEVEKTGKG